MSRRVILAAIVAFVVIDILLIGTRPVLSPDETRYGSIAAQMLQSGDWLHLRMSGFHFYEKPALVYWMTAVSIEVFGHNAFAIRLPDALCTGMGALALAMAVRRGARAAGRRPDDAASIGALAALIYITMVLPAIGASLSTLDAPLAGFVTTACALFFMAASEPAYANGRRMAWLVSAGVFAGLGFMSKGLPAIAFPALAIVPWLAWERRWRDLMLLPWIPIAVAAMVAAPWAIAIHIAEPGFWERFIIHEHFRRFAGGAANQPSATWAFYLLIVPLGMIPWIAVVPDAARWWPGLMRMDSAARFAVCWALGPLLLLSLSSGKLPTYALPAFPPLAWLMVLGLMRALESRPIRANGILPRVPGAVLMLLAVGALVFALGGDWTTPQVERVWLEWGHWRAALLAVVLAAWGAGDWWANRARSAPQRLMRMGLSPVAAIACFGLLFPDAIIDDHKIPEASVQANRTELLAAPTLIADPKMGHAVAWILGRTDFLVYGAPEEFGNGLGLSEDDSRLVSADDIVARVTSARARGAVAIAVHEGGAAQILKRPELSQPTRQVDLRAWKLLVYE